MSFVQGNQSTLVLWDLTTGLEIRRVRPKDIEEIEDFALNPNGFQAAVTGKRVLNKDSVIVIDFSTGQNSLLPHTAADWPIIAIRYSADGKRLIGKGADWDVTVTPPMRQQQEKEIWNDLPSRNRRIDYVGTSDGGPIWILREGTTLRELPRGKLDFAGSQYSADGRWMAIWASNYELSGRLDNCGLGWLVRWTVPAKHWFNIVSTESGKTVNRVPGVLGEDDIVHFGSKESIWTITRWPHEKDGSLLPVETFALREWSVHSARPPIWLWGLTVAGVVVMIRELRSLRWAKAS